jgi:hypothetical protein
VGKTKLATIFAACAVLFALSAAGHKLLWIADFFWAKGGVFEHLGEMRPLLLDAGGPTWTHVHSQFGLLYLASPLMFIWLRRMGTQAQFRCGAWFFLALFILSFAQQRFTHLFAPAFVLAPFLLVAQKVKERRPRMACYAAIAVLLAEPFAVGMASRQPMGPSAATEQARQVAISLNEADPGGQGAVFAPPNLGNALVWLTRRPVVTNTFFYPQKFVFDWQVRQAQTNDELERLLRERGIEFFVAADDARFRVMLAHLLGLHEEARAWQSVQYAPCHERLLEFAYDRLACATQTAEAFQLIADLHFPGTSFSLLRRLRVFRLNPSPRYSVVLGIFAKRVQVVLQ